MEYKNEEHYVVILEEVEDGEVSVKVLAVKHSYEEAVMFLAETVKEKRNEAEDYGYEVMEDAKSCFDAGESGFYDNNHISLYIKEVIN